MLERQRHSGSARPCSRRGPNAVVTLVLVDRDVEFGCAEAPSSGPASTEFSNFRDSPRCHSRQLQLARGRSSAALLPIRRSLFDAHRTVEHLAAEADPPDLFLPSAFYQRGCSRDIIVALVCVVSLPIPVVRSAGTAARPHVLRSRHQRPLPVPKLTDPLPAPCRRPSTATNDT